MVAVVPRSAARPTLARLTPPERFLTIRGVRSRGGLPGTTSCDKGEAIFTLTKLREVLHGLKVGAGVHLPPLSSPRLRTNRPATRVVGPITYQPCAELAFFTNQGLEPLKTPCLGSVRERFSNAHLHSV